MVTVAFRVDASVEIGTGHLMRCLTLADALKQRGAQNCFVSRHMPGHLQNLLGARGHQYMQLDSSSGGGELNDLPHAHWLGTSQHADAQDTIHALSTQAWDWLVVDHYALDVRWESVLRQTTKKLLVIDDIADRQHDCDVLLDQNFYTDMNTRYAGKIRAHCRLLLGPRYALLRKEFAELHEQVNPRTGLVKRILVFWGGMDVDNFTAQSIEALANIGNHDFIVDVVIGELHPCRDQIVSACVNHGFVCHVQTDRMAELMASADLAIGAGGSVSWERCCLGLPALVFATAANQQRLVEDAAWRGLMYAPQLRDGRATAIELHLKALLDNPCLLQLISRKGLEYVDGLGAQRVLHEIGCDSIVIRKATHADSENLFTWRNDPSIRAVSRNAKPIDRSTHETWIKAVLSDSDQVLLIGKYQDKAVGVVRFDVKAKEAEVSIYLVPGQQGTGFGTELLLAAENWLAEHRSDVLSIKAEVLDGNQRSHRLFQKCDYRMRSAMYTKQVRQL